MTYDCCCRYRLELLIKRSVVSVWHIPVAVFTVLKSWSSSQQYLFDIRLLLYVQSWTPDQAVSSICMTYACCCMYSLELLIKRSAVSVWHMSVAVGTDLNSWSNGQQYLFAICLLLYVQSLTPNDGRKDRPKHVVCYFSKINVRYLCIWLVLLWKYITMHGPMNVKYICLYELWVF